MVDQLRQVGQSDGTITFHGAVPVARPRGAGRLVELAQGSPIVKVGIGPGSVLHEQGHDQRGVAAAEEAADRDVAHHVQPDALDQDRSSCSISSSSVPWCLGS